METNQLPLYLMYGVVVPQRGTEGVEAVLVQHGVERVRADHVASHPPGDGDQPQHDERHHHEVVHKIAAELAETPGHLINVNIMFNY